MSGDMEIDEEGLEAQIREYPGPVVKVFNAKHLLDKIIDFVKEQKRDELFVYAARTRQGNLRSFLDLRLVDKKFNERIRLAVRREFRKVVIDVDDNYIRCNRFHIHKHMVAPRAHRQAAPQPPPNPPPINIEQAQQLHDDMNDLLDQADLLVEVLDDFMAHGQEIPPLAQHPPQFPEQLPEVQHERPVQQEQPERPVDPEPQRRNIPIEPEDVSDDDRSDDDEEMNDADDDDSGSEHDDEEMAVAENEPSEDLLDSQYLQRFLQWLADTFNPIVECITIYDSWSLKPCWMPASWTSLQKFRSLHPDMEYCGCARCVETVRSVHTFYQISFRMCQDALMNREKSFKTLGCTDAFLADIAIHYTVSRDNALVFDVERFEREFGGIRVNELFLATQAIPDYHSNYASPHPLEVIQSLIKIWEVRTIQFELIKVMDNDFYVRRRSWETSGAFRHAQLVTVRYDTFDEYYHLKPYREAGTLDAFSREVVVPIFDLRIEMGESRQMSYNLSMLSLASRDNVADSGYPIDWPFQGRIAFSMFKSNHAAFIQSSQPEFQGKVGMSNWLKYVVRGMMRWTWGPRAEAAKVFNKNAYWIYFIEDGMSIRNIWRDHMGDLFRANFPTIDIIFDEGEGFKTCPSRRVVNYHCITRPDILDTPRHCYYITFHDRLKNNRTFVKFIQVKL